MAVLKLPKVILPVCSHPTATLYDGVHMNQPVSFPQMATLYIQAIHHPAFSQPIATLPFHVIFHPAFCPMRKLHVLLQTEEYQSHQILLSEVRRSNSVLFVFIMTSATFVLPIKSLSPIVFPESVQLGHKSELVEVQVARPLASETRTLFSQGDPPQRVTCPER